jgi:dimethylargininase
VRPPAANFADGLTTVVLGVPDFATALGQHSAYCEALRQCDLAVTVLDPDLRFPDSTFVEDTALVTERRVIVTRPGADARRGEVHSIRNVLDGFFPSIDRIDEPGTVDAGDVCEAGNHFFIGISERTNEAGAQQLAELLASFAYTSSLIDIRGLKGILHLKSGLAYLADNQLVVIDSLANYKQFGDYDLVHVKPGEEYAANCVMVNGRVLVAAGFPSLEYDLQIRGHQTIALEMSEFQKMDGGLSCLSLRW